MSALPASSRKVSLLVPCFNESDSLDLYFHTVIPILEGAGYPFEIICVDDGSRDDTLSVLDRWHRLDGRVKYISLSRNFGKEKALTAALDFATGDAVIPMDADLQDPPHLILEMLKLWEEGYDVVNAVRLSRSGDSFPKRITANLFYKFIGRISDSQIPSNVGDFRLLSKAPLAAVRSLRETRRFMKGLFSWVGFRVSNVYFERPARAAGETKFNYWRLLNFAVEGIVSFSSFPLRIAGYFGFLLSIISVAYGVYLMVRTMLFGNPVPGYPSLMVALLFVGGVQMFFIGVLGEYLSRIYDEVKQRPLYLVRTARGFE